MLNALEQRQNKEVFIAESEQLLRHLPGYENGLQGGEQLELVAQQTLASGHAKSHSQHLSSPQVDQLHSDAGDDPTAASADSGSGNSSPSHASSPRARLAKPNSSSPPPSPGARRPPAPRSPVFAQQLHAHQEQHEQDESHGYDDGSGYAAENAGQDENAY